MNLAGIKLKVIEKVVSTNDEEWLRKTFRSCEDIIMAHYGWDKPTDRISQDVFDLIMW